MRWPVCLLLSCTAACTFLFSADGQGDETPESGNLCVDKAPDGTKTKAEECDDGNGDNGDSCTNDCRLARCGDGFVNLAPDQGAEQCDDGNDSNRDSCTNACEKAVCGDGFVRDYIESCDDETESCSKCVTCADLEGSHIAGMFDERCYIIGNGGLDWQSARSSCMGTLGGELASIDNAPNIDSQSAKIYEVLATAASGSGASLPGSLWLGMYYHVTHQWVWLGTTRTVADHWLNGVIPVKDDTPSADILRVLSPTMPPHNWTPNDRNTTAASLCMRVPPPLQSDDTRMMVASSDNHIYLEQLATFRSSAGRGNVAEQRATCLARGAHLATFENVADAMEIAPMIRQPLSHVGADRVGDTNDFVWTKSGEPVDPILWADGKGPAERPDDDCAHIRQDGELEVASCTSTGATALCEWD